MPLNAGSTVKQCFFFTSCLTTLLNKLQQYKIIQNIVNKQNYIPRVVWEPCETLPMKLKWQLHIHWQGVQIESTMRNVTRTMSYGRDNHELGDHVHGMYTSNLVTHKSRFVSLRWRLKEERIEKLFCLYDLGTFTFN